MRMCMHTCARVCTCVHLCARVCTCVHLCARVCICVCVRVCVISWLSILFRIQAKPTNKHTLYRRKVALIFVMWDYFYLFLCASDVAKSQTCDPINEIAKFNLH